MSKLIEAQAGEHLKGNKLPFDKVTVIEPKHHKFTEEEIKVLLGGDFEIIELKTKEDIILVQEGKWDNEAFLKNGIATSVSGIYIRGTVIITERKQCRL